MAPKFQSVLDAEPLNERGHHLGFAKRQRPKSCQERGVQAIVSTFPKRQRADFEVEWLIDHHPFRLRLIVRWHPQTQSFAYLLTHLLHTMKRCKKRPVKPFYLVLGFSQPI